MLNRVNVQSEDVWRCANENANNAKLIGRFVSQHRLPLNSKSTCVMHTGNLILEHALGICTRTCNHQILDSFDVGKDLCIKVHKNLMGIMSKRNKHVFDAYKASCKKHLMLIVIALSFQMKLVYPGRF
jgi:hypothetical protein